MITYQTGNKELKYTHLIVADTKLFWCTTRFYSRDLTVSYFSINFFFIIKDFNIASYADANIPYVSANNMSANNMDGVVKSLEKASTKLLKWFSGNLMKSNANKCHLLISTNNTANIRVENFDIKNSDFVEWS